MCLGKSNSSLCDRQSSTSWLNVRQFKSISQELEILNTTSKEANRVIRSRVMGQSVPSNRTPSRLPSERGPLIPESSYLQRVDSVKRARAYDTPNSLRTQRYRNLKISNGGTRSRRGPSRCVIRVVGVPTWSSLGGCCEFGGGSFADYEGA